MPALSQINATEEEEVHAALAQIPVTIVTASGAPMPPLASGLLKKPVDLDVLLRIVARSCNGSGDRSG